MAEYSNLSATINAQIRANGVQAITGPVLNAVLTAMVNVLGDGYRLNGVAVPADNPGSPDNRVAYLAAQDGTYTNFGGLTISGEVALLLWDSAWTKETLFSIDTAVTPGSGHLVTSGAVDDALTTLAGNIAAAYMQLVPAATEGNLAEFDNAGQVRDAGLATSDLATKDGHYPDLFAGFAGNLVDTRSAGTPQGPYAFRQSGGDGVDYMVRIKGKTEAFNQLVPDASKDFTNTSTDTRAYLAWAVQAVSGGGTITSVYSENISAAKKVSFVVDIPSDTVSFRIKHNGSNSDIFILVLNSVTFGGHKMLFTANVKGYDVTTVGGLIVEDMALFDLTLEGLGLTTADQFRALHPLPYYNYNAGVLKNNAATGLKTVGFNQWDEEWEEGDYSPSTGEKRVSAARIRCKNPIPVLPSTSYYFKAPSSIWVNAYDANGIFIRELSEANANQSFTVPANCYYITFALLSATLTYNHDICINLSDASRNGTYEPYWERTLALGLNSIPCHDENNNAVVVNGLDGVGTSYDEAVVENGMVTKIIKRTIRLNARDYYFQDSGTPYVYRTMGINEIANYGSWSGNLLSNRYAPRGNDGFTPDKAIGTISQQIWIKDAAYATAEAFNTAMSGGGVEILCVLATPKHLTIDTPFPAFVEVDNLGTEKRLPEDTAADPQGGFESDSNYSISTANLVRLLNL